MSTRIIEVLDPTASAAEERLRLARTLPDLKGKVIGLLDNSKPNFDVFLNRIRELLAQKYGVAPRTVQAKKSLVGLPFKEVGEFARQCDAVVNGMCD